jgi:hypothetical protein
MVTTSLPQLVSHASTGKMTPQIKPLSLSEHILAGVILDD